MITAREIYDIQKRIENIENNSSGNNDCTKKQLELLDISNSDIQSQVEPLMAEKDLNGTDVLKDLNISNVEYIESYENLINEIKKESGLNYLSLGRFTIKEKEYTVINDDIIIEFEEECNCDNIYTELNYTLIPCIKSNNKIIIKNKELPYGENNITLYISAGSQLLDYYIISIDKRSSSSVTLSPSSYTITNKTLTVNFQTEVEVLGVKLNITGSDSEFPYTATSFTQNSATFSLNSVTDGTYPIKIQIKTTDSGGETPTVPVSSVSVAPSSYNFSSANTNTKLYANILPSNATNKSVNWASSNQNVAIVSSDGTVTSKGNGNCTITCTTNDGNKTSNCNITVNIPSTSVPVTGVTLNRTNHVFPDQYMTLQLTADVLPLDATNKEVIWSSSNTNVATVTQSGLVTKKNNGTCDIIVTTVDGNKTANCEVVVGEQVVVPPEEQKDFVKELSDKQTVLGMSLRCESSSLLMFDVNVKTSQTEGVVYGFLKDQYDDYVRMLGGDYGNVIQEGSSFRINGSNKMLYSYSNKEFALSCRDVTSSDSNVWIPEHISVGTTFKEAEMVIKCDGVPITLTNGLIKNSNKIEIIQRLKGYNGPNKENALMLIESKHTIENGIVLMDTKITMLKDVFFKNGYTAMCPYWTDNVTKVISGKTNKEYSTKTDQSLELEYWNEDGTASFCCVDTKTGKNLKIGFTIDDYNNTTRVGKSGRGIPFTWLEHRNSEMGKFYFNSLSNHTLKNGEIITSKLRFIVSKDNGSIPEPPTNDVPVSSISLNKYNHAFTELNSSIILKPTILPNNSTNKNVIWRSSNDSVAIIDSNGMVTSKSNGTCVITATTVNGNKESSCNISVDTNAAITPPQPPEIDEIVLTKYNIGSSTGYPTVGYRLSENPINVSMSIDDGPFNYRATTFHKNDASFDIRNIQKGVHTFKVKFEVYGKVIITRQGTIYYNDNGRLPATSINVTIDKRTIEIGEFTKANVILEPYGSTSDVMWDIVNPAVAYMKQDCIIEGNVPGTMNITATVNDNHDLKASSSITVVNSNQEEAIEITESDIVFKDYKAVISKNGITETYDVGTLPMSGTTMLGCSMLKLQDELGRDCYLTLHPGMNSRFSLNGKRPFNGGWSDMSSTIAPDGMCNYTRNLKQGFYNISTNQAVVDRSVYLFNCSLDEVGFYEIKGEIPDGYVNKVEWKSTEDKFAGAAWNWSNRFYIQLNSRVLPSSVETCVKTLVHELGHTLGYGDSATAKPTIFDYTRPDKCVYLQPNDLFTLRREFKDVIEGTSKMIASNDNVLLSVHFDYKYYDTETEMKNDSDLVLECIYESVDADKYILNITDGVDCAYNVYNFKISNIIKGEKNVNDVIKVKVNENNKFDPVVNSTYKLYLAEYEISPCSPINDKQAIIKLN